MTDQTFFRKKIPNYANPAVQIKKSGKNHTFIERQLLKNA